MLHPFAQLAIAFALALTLMTALWLIARAKKNATIVDVGWSLAVGILAVFYAITGTGDVSRRGLIGMLAALWSLRLSGYLFIYRVLPGHEDKRYAALRERWGSRAERNFFWFFEAQAVLAVVFSLPMWVIAQMPDSLHAIDFAGVALWWIAVTCESLADRQLARFRANPANHGNACREGLWQYSRHPNYFFEFLHWWAYALIGWGADWWLICAAMPWLMLWFLLHVTGIRPTEARAIENRSEDYAHYQRTTSAFIPWPPAKDGR